MATARTAVVHDISADYREIVDWYRDRLAKARPPVGLVWEPVKIGPTWQWSAGDGWSLPKWSLGWQMMAWCGHWLRQDGQPWQFTMEQARFLLWFYALDERGRWLFNSAVLQRLKGWGKDPVAATVSAAACFAPIRFDHWDGDKPVGVMDPVAWVQLIAVSQQQTQNTMKLFPSLFTEDAMSEYGIQIGRLNVWGLGDTVQIEAITSNFLSVEGGRPTLVVPNETQNWNSSNQGHDMIGAVEGNLAKSPGGRARRLDVCNAYRPGEDSVGERAREAWETAQANNVDIGVLYDSLEAPPDAPLTIDDAPAVVASIAGDSYWLDVEPDGRIVKSIANTQNAPSESRRKWYNQITATADAWLSPTEWGAGSPSEVVEGEPITMFFDGSKSDDATALIGCRCSDGYVFKIGIWTPTKDQPLVDREAVDYRVRGAFDFWKPIAFFADLSDARDDETGERYWEPYADAWGRDFGRKLQVHAVQSGPRKHAVIWDMRSPAHLQIFTEHAERFTSDAIDGTLPHDGDLLMTQHVRNARRRPNKWGIGLGKEHRESARKIDAAVCAVGARMLWRMWQATSTTKRAPGKGRVIVLE